MAFQRVVTRTLPDGSIRKVYPFHVTLEGMKTVLLCRSDDDYDHMEKSFYIAARVTNSLVVIGIAMSNHAHLCLLSASFEAAFKTGELIKKRHSQYLSRVYSDKEIMKRSRIDVQYLDSDWYVRNALAYIARNAIDAGSRVEDYRWSGYRGMFVGGKLPAGGIHVSSMSRREREALFHTHIDLSQVPWALNKAGGIEPVSACDYSYLENAFANDQAFFLKTIGSLNPAEMKQKLVINNSFLQTDSQMLAIIANLSEKWFGKQAKELTPEMKSRLVYYLHRCYHTTPAQLARCMNMSPEIISALIRRQ